ncbi:MAG: hypothetical protein H6739_08830 [Alphaproteobacteria bacterium]|nr:hypothetical protein [Alphaproteobacteria bacterium]
MISILSATWTALALAAPTEDEVLALHDAGKWIEARTAAEALLAEQPGSQIGHYVLGRVLWIEEGDLAPARRHLERAVALYVAQDDEPDVAWRTNAYALETLAGVRQEMADHRGQLEALDAHDDAYDPDLIGQRAWPNMMLDREHRAREHARDAIEGEIRWQQTLGYTAMCAIEARFGSREDAWDACQAAVTFERDSGSDMQIAASNASGAALYVFRFEEAEALLHESAAGSGQEVANPWARLALLTLAQGRGEEAVDAVVRMRRFKQQQPPSMRDQARAEVDAVAATVMLAAGHPTEGLTLIDRAIAFPDRGGLSSGAAEDTLVGHTLLRLALRQLQRELRRERRAVEPWWRRAWGGLVDLWPDPQDVADRAVVRAALSDYRRLMGSVRPYTAHSPDVLPPWRHGQLVGILGPGVVSAAIQQARQVETLPEAAAWLDALQAEVAWRLGDPARARELGGRALESLPEAEALLRGRTAAILADAAWAQGDRAEALSLYERALQVDPGVMRRLSIALPAVVRVDADGAAAALVGAALQRSPRLAPGSEGFAVSVEGGAAPRVCLRSPQGALIACTEPVPAPEEGTPRDHARAVLDAFHDRAFSMPLGLSAVDLRSLDSQTVVAQEARRERVEALLQELGGEAPSDP